eukprot:752118-Hanusia_phi.AAC.3
MTDSHSTHSDGNLRLGPSPGPGPPGAGEQPRTSTVVRSVTHSVSGVPGQCVAGDHVWSWCDVSPLLLRPGSSHLGPLQLSPNYPAPDSAFQSLLAPDSV